MKVKVFTLNENKKIEFTENELKELLDEIYNEGYKDGANKYYYYTTPYKPWWSTTPLYSTTSAATTINSDSITVKPETTTGTVKYNTQSTDCSCTGCKK